MVNHTDFLLTTFNAVQIIFTIASFLSVVAISVDRFLALRLHLRYQEIVTNDRVFCCGHLNLDFECTLRALKFVFELRKTTCLRDYACYLGVLFHYYRNC